MIALTPLPWPALAVMWLGILGMLVWMVYRLWRAMRAKRAELAGYQRFNGQLNGPALIQGRCLDDSLLTPFSKKRVAGFRVVVKVLRGKHQTFQRIVDLTQVGDFWVDDGRHRMLVRGHGSYLLTPNPVREELEADILLDSRFQHIVQAVGIPPHTLTDVVRVRLTEYLLEAGDEVQVYGQPSRSLDRQAQRASYRETPWQLEVTGQPTAPVVISTFPTGQLSQALRTFADVPPGLVPT